MASPVRSAAPFSDSPPASCAREATEQESPRTTDCSTDMDDPASSVSEIDTDDDSWVAPLTTRQSLAIIEDCTVTVEPALRMPETDTPASATLDPLIDSAPPTNASLPME